MGGAALILEGSSPLASSFGFIPTSETVSTIHIVDEHNPSLPIVWNKAIDIPRYEIPADARVFAKERWTGAPVARRLSSGGRRRSVDCRQPGRERLRALSLPACRRSPISGLKPSFRASRLWAFFDYSYRSRADPDYLAARWRAAGISALHAAAWHFYDADPRAMNICAN